MCCPSACHEHRCHRLACLCELTCRTSLLYVARSLSGPSVCLMKARRMETMMLVSRHSRKQMKNTTRRFVTCQWLREPRHDFSLLVVDAGLPGTAKTLTPIFPRLVRLVSRLQQVGDEQLLFVVCVCVRVCVISSASTCCTLNICCMNALLSPLSLFHTHTHTLSLSLSLSLRGSVWASEFLSDPARGPARSHGNFIRSASRSR